MAQNSDQLLKRAANQIHTLQSRLTKMTEDLTIARRESEQVAEDEAKLLELVASGIDHSTYLRVSINILLYC